jgi:hypothetical protein
VVGAYRGSGENHENGEVLPHFPGCSVTDWNQEGNQAWMLHCVDQIGGDTCEHRKAYKSTFVSLVQCQCVCSSIWFTRRKHFGSGPDSPMALSSGYTLSGDLRVDYEDVDKHC